jgi:hypothetical protein
MREHPDKPIRVFDVVQDPACAKDYAADRPELVSRARAIYAQEHIDSEWYRNPGESNTSFKAKQDRAHREGTLQPTTPANRPVSGLAAAGSGTNISKKRKGRP